MIIHKKKTTLSSEMVFALQKMGFRNSVTYR